MHFNCLISYRYEKSIPGPAVSGFKNGKAPKNAVAGMNGTYRLASTPPRVIATVKDNTGCKINVDLYHAIKAELSKIGMRISKNRVEIICDYLIKDHTPFEMVLDEHNKWFFIDFDIRKIIDKRGA